MTTLDPRLTYRPPKMLLTLSETAERLRLSVRTIRRLTATGVLPTIRVSARRLWFHVEPQQRAGILMHINERPGTPCVEGGLLFGPRVQYPDRSPYNEAKYAIAQSSSYHRNHNDNY